MSDFNIRRAPGLDLVRSVAISCVLLCHYWPLYKRFPALVQLEFVGHLGVEIFFVLSGFLIGSILLRQAADAGIRGGQFTFADSREFWVRRWFRTLPNYVLFLGLFLLYDQPWVSGQWKTWLLSGVFLQNLVFDLSNINFSVAWSLCVEEWLYLLLPLLLITITRRTKTCAQAAFYTAAVLIILPTLLRCTTIGKAWDLGVRHVVIYRLDAIAYGVLLAAFARYRRSFFERLAAGRWALVGTVGIACIWGFYAVFGENWIRNAEAGHGIKWFIMYVLFFAITSLSIAPIVAWASRLPNMPLGFKTAVYRISLYSYSMYLAHLLVYYYANPLLYAGVRWIFGEFHGIMFAMLVLNIATVFGFSAFVYHVWEAPMTRLRERFAKAQPAVKLTVC